MQQYTETELTNKIHTFLAKKSQKFPELKLTESKTIQKNAVKEPRDGSIFTALENLNSFWAQRISPY